MKKQIFETGHRYEILDAMDTLMACIKNEKYWRQWVLVMPAESNTQEFYESAFDDETYTKAVETFLKIFSKIGKNA